MFDRNLWNAERILVETEILRLKKLRTETMQPGWTWREMQALPAYKLKATELYAIRALARGRAISVQPDRLAYWKDVAEKALPKYTLPDPVREEVPEQVAV